MPFTATITDTSTGKTYQCELPFTDESHAKLARELGMRDYRLTFWLYANACPLTVTALKPNVRTLLTDVFSDAYRGGQRLDRVNVICAEIASIERDETLTADAVKAIGEYRAAHEGRIRFDDIANILHNVTNKETEA